MATTTVRTDTSNPLWNLQAEYFPEVFRQAEDIYFQGAPEYFPGKTVADLDPVQVQGLNRQVAATGGQQGLSDALTGGVQAGIPGIQGAYDTLSGFAAGTDPVLQDLANRASQATQGQYAGAGTLGSARGTRAGAQAASDTIANTRLNAAQSLGNLGLSAAQLVPTAQSAALAPAQSLQEVGGFKRLYDQDLINAERERYDYNVNLPYNWLSQFSTALSPNAAAPTTQTQTTSEKASGLESAVGTVGAVGSLLSGLGTIASFF